MLSVQTFGKLEITINGHSVSLRMSKAAVLLVYLMRNKDVSYGRDQLATLLWPQENERKSRENFRQALYQIRRIFDDKQTAEQYLTVTRDIVQFHAGTNFILDANLFEQKAAKKEWECALDLYEGEFLATYYSPDAQELAEWQVTTREQLHHLAVYACTQLTRESEKKDLTRAAHFARRLLSLEPWAEEGYRVLMRWWVSQGQVTTALAEYQKCVAILSEELGIKPTAKTTALYEQIRDGRLPSSSSLTHNLPALLTPLVGRQQELITLQQYLAEPSQRLLTLVGPGGIGKTKLMLELGWITARTPLPMPFTAIYFISLAEFEPDEAISWPEQISSHLLQSLDIPLPSSSATSSPIDILAKEWGDRPILLLLDNWEHLIAGSSVLTKWLKAVPHLQIVVTSREPLRLYGETVFHLLGLDKSSSVADSPHAAGKLFVQCVRRVQPQFQWDEKTAPLISRICHVVGGYPLALELAAAQLQGFTLAEVADSVAEGLDLLNSAHADLLPRQRDMRQILAQSWHNLPKDQQQILAQLSLFRQPFTAVEAQAVTGASRMQLALVVAHFWLRRADNGRYQYHELLRHFAYEQLVAQPDLYQQARRAYIQEHFQYLQSRRKLLEENPSNDIFVDLRRRHADLEQAWRWASSEEWLDEIAEVVRPLASFYIGVGLLSHGIRLFKQTIRQLRQLSVTPKRQHALAYLLLEEAVLRNMQVNCELVPAAMIEVIELAHSLADETLLIRAYHEYGTAVVRLGRFTEGRELLKIGLDLAEQCQDWAQVANFYFLLGNIEQDEGMCAASIIHYDQALKWYEQLNNLVHINAIRHNLAIALTHLGQYRRVRSLHQQNLAAIRRLERRSGLALTIEGLGFVSLAQKQFRLAELYLQKALRMYIEIEDLDGVAYTQLYLGHWAVAQDMLSTAVTHYRAMITARQTLKHTHLLAQGWAGLAEVAWRRGYTHEAMGYVERCWPNILADQVRGEEPMPVYLSCYRVLTAVADDRALLVLDKALAWLNQEIAALGNDKLACETFLAVPTHQALLAAAQERRGELNTLEGDNGEEAD
ncbi:MAG TPA: BTAD domain-containing putative transcriptional regulator [Anaerolineae bacterium]|nr:BTAD domain-containing putative transcriptional regulator [Anaerolineae bacterium]